MRSKPFLIAIAISTLLSACGGGYGKSSSSSSGSSSGASSSNATVKTSSNAQLGHAVLVNGAGMTLYRLSGESANKFICTGSCLSIWHPLTAPANATPKGIGSLSLIKRPEGAEQVAYNGMPLYTFGQDKASGEANGQGVKDVGTWMAATPSGSAGQGASGSSMPSGSSSSSGSGSGSSGGTGY